MIYTDLLNLWEAADMLDVETWRLSRLGRYLRIDPADKQVPLATVQEIADLTDPQQRYAALRSWLLESLPGRASP